MAKIKNYLLPVLMIVLTLCLTMSFRTYMMDYIIRPIALLCWVVWRLITSVDQSVYWIALIGICIILVIRMIPSDKDNSHNPSYSYSYKPPPRVVYWQSLIDGALLGQNERERLRNSLIELLITQISLVERTTKLAAEKIIANGVVTLQPEARKILYPTGWKPDTNQSINKRKWTVIIPRWLIRMRRRFIHPDYISIDQLLGWMENELEISDE